MEQKLGSHNSWSYLTPKKWWMKLIGFTAKCQNVDVMTQYDTYGVRMFDLRIRFSDKPIDNPMFSNDIKIVHGPIEYDYSYYQLIGELEFFNSMKDVTIRLLLDLRGVKKEDYEVQRKKFNRFYRGVLRNFTNIKYVLGRDLPEWKKCIITLSDGSIKEDYASVSKPKYIDDWYPYWYAKRKNKYIKRDFFNNINSTEEFLLIDFVNI